MARLLGCPHCRAEFTFDDWARATACPACGLRLSFFEASGQAARRRRRRRGGVVEPAGHPSPDAHQTGLDSWSGRRPTFARPEGAAAWAAPQAFMPVPPPQPSASAPRHRRRSHRRRRSRRRPAALPP